MEYKVKRDFAPIFLINLLFFCLFWAYSPFVRNLWLYITLYAVTLALYIIYLDSVLYSTCEIKDGVLSFRSGMFVCKVDLSKVVSAKKCTNIYPSLSHSIDRIRIESKEDGKLKVTYVAVKNNDDLINFLQACIAENQAKNNKIDVVRPASKPEQQPESANQSLEKSNQVVVIVPPTDNSKVVVEADEIKPVQQKSDKKVETVVETTEQVIEIVKKAPQKTTKVAKTKTTKTKTRSTQAKRKPAEAKKKSADKEAKSNDVKAPKSKKLEVEHAVKVDVVNAEQTKKVVKDKSANIQSTEAIEKEVKKVARHRNTVRKDQIKAATAEELNEAIKSLVSDENNVQIKITTSKKRTTQSSPSSNEKPVTTGDEDQAK